MAAQGPMVVQAGGRIVEILATYAGSGDVTRAQLDAWIKSHKLVTPTVKDAPGKAGASFAALERREIAYIVDLKTMKIVKRILGSTAGTGDSAAKTAMADLLVLLKGG